MNNPLSEDLNFILAATRQSWEGLRGERLFLTGGTGFFGCWLLESFVWANDQLDLGATAVVLTRNPGAFARKVPHLAAHPAVRLHPGNVRDFDYPAGPFARIIHAANDSHAALDTIVQGTRRVLEFARQCGTREVLLTSSGAVYGTQPAKLLHLPEGYPGRPAPTAPASLYSQGKWLAEVLCMLHNTRYGLRAKIARCFAFVGPYLPLGANFAVGNFLRDGLSGGPIRVQGDGTPYRSYLYAADLAVWLWTILDRGQPGRPYNVGAEEAINIGDLARLVAGQFRPAPEVEIALSPTPGVPAPRYVPATTRAREELGLHAATGLVEALRKTLAWHTATEQIRSSS